MNKTLHFDLNNRPQVSHITGILTTVEFPSSAARLRPSFCCGLGGRHLGKAIRSGRDYSDAGSSADSFRSFRILSLPLIPQYFLWKEGKPMSHEQASRWLFSDLVTKRNSTSLSQPSGDKVDRTAGTSLVTPTVRPIPVEFNSLSLDWLLNPDKPRTLLNRMLAHLALAEAKENNPHFRDDIRIAWLTCQWAFDGVLEPHVAASYRVLGVHPNLVWDKLTERRQVLLGDEYPDWYDAAGNMRPDVPKKPSVPSPAISIVRAKEGA
jgi:hypothetical protein